MCATSGVLLWGYNQLTSIFPVKDMDNFVSKFNVLALEAKHIDDETGQPDCGVADKKAQLLKIAKALNVEIKIP